MNTMIITHTIREFKSYSAIYQNKHVILDSSVCQVPQNGLQIAQNTCFTCKGTAAWNF